VSAVTGAGRSALAPGIAGTVALVVARDGRLPVGADEAVAEAAGSVLVVGSGAEEAAGSVTVSGRAWWCETGPGMQAGALAAALSPVLAAAHLVILPASPDGRDLAPRLAAALDRPLIARAQSVSVVGPDGTEPAGAETAVPATTRVVATVARLDDRITVPVSVHGPAVATLVPGTRSVTGVGTTELIALAVPMPGQGSAGRLVAEPEMVALIEPDPATMDLADATRVLAGGAGLVEGETDSRATETFGLLAEVSAALGASTGATRVATDAGWIGYDRQIGTTGVGIDPDLYIAFGISGAVQHVGGLGAPRHIVSVNRDPSCPMTAMADLGLVTDARALLEELAVRLEVGATTAPGTGADRG
jgi:electron transfer flavoprotein alpha subunit